MSAATTWMPMYWGDYLTATAHLSTAEHGAYLLLIGHYWTTSKCLANDQARLARIARMTPDEWEKVSGTISEFFTVTEEGWFHDRIEQELEKSNKILDARRAAGKIGGQKSSKSRANGEANPKHVLEHTGKQTAKQNPTQSQSPLNPYTPLNGNPKYSFARKVVKLTAEDLEGWRTSFRNIQNLEALLESRDAWLADNPGRQKSWFNSTSTWLAKKDAEAAANAPAPDPDLEARREAREAARIKREEAEAAANLARIEAIDRRETERSIRELGTGKVTPDDDDQMPDIPAFLVRKA